MKRIDRLVGWGIFGIGLLHCLLAPLIFREFGTRAMWFIGTGFAMMYQGAFNLLRVQYGSAAPGVKRVSVAANLGGLAFAILFVLVRGARAFNPSSFLFLGLLAGAAALSLLPSHLAGATNRGRAQS